MNIGTERRLSLGTTRTNIGVVAICRLMQRSPNEHHPRDHPQHHWTYHDHHHHSALGRRRRAHLKLAMKPILPAGEELRHYLRWSGWEMRIREWCAAGSDGGNLYGRHLPCL